MVRPRLSLNPDDGASAALALLLRVTVSFVRLPQNSTKAA